MKKGGPVFEQLPCNKQPIAKVAGMGFVALFLTQNRWSCVCVSVRLGYDCTDSSRQWL